MTKKDLEKQQTQFYKNVVTWFLGEMAKWSKQHNTYIQDFGITRIYFIGGEDSYEPYGLHNDEELGVKLQGAIKHLESLLEDLADFDFRYQTLVFDDETQTIY